MEIKGRQNLDAFLVVYEVIDKIWCVEEEKVVFKIDFQKTYDHVE